LIDVEQKKDVVAWVGVIGWLAGILYWARAFVVLE
jgi:uncharacterized membrane protein